MIENILKVFDCGGILFTDEVSETNLLVRKVVHTMDKKYVCVVCGWVYDEAVEGVKFEDQPADYLCPVCGVGKDQFEEM